MVENFRNFRALEITPFPSVAVILGENGIGKSNLLHALRLVLDPDLPDSARRLRAEDICDYAPGTLADGVEVRIEVELTDIEGDTAAEATLDGCFVSLTPLVARLAYTYRPRVDPQQVDRPLTRDDYDFDIVGGPDGDRDARRVRRDVSLSVLPALRDAADALSRYRGSPLQELLDANPPAPSALEAAAKGIQEVMDELATDKQVTKVAEDLSARLADLAGPQLDVIPTLGFASSAPARLLRSIRLYVDPNRSRSVADTSTGNANVIYLGLLLERLQTRRATGAVVATVLAVEEPEAHVHPVLQRQLFRYLLRSETGLVVTTHSSHVAAVTRLDAIVLLRRDETGATVAATTARAGLSRVQRADLERYLDVSRAELLFCSAAILVEGQSEAYLLPALACALGFDLDAHGVIVANIGGTDFAPYRSLLGEKALAVPHVIVTDGDPLRNGEYVLAGLKRAARLLPPGDERNELMDAIATLLEYADPDVDTTEEQQWLVPHGIFVGVRTLELDLVPLLAAQLSAAHVELVTSPVLRARFDDAMAAIAEDDFTADDCDEVLRRVEHVSKGRYAQRLAAHVETAGAGIAQRVERDFAETSGDAEAGVALRAHLSTGELIALGTYGYLLAALDQISRRVRGSGLIERPCHARNGSGEAASS
ncbi:AAA family ATPase [Amycolatopsis sp. A133]|uniref:ATP-dependent nuclease n=1 Tax=Amycolatopsis sp. A133 TaxID=3064472 RepID=UPI0027F717C0|nr:AAA family ATPase [Amycolatopsis sp. A133]MDQ7802736.1 AAA family ATPase [Amycolatopsis sp. A133]